MKPKYLAHPSQARCIDSPVEQERLLAMGWLLTKPAPRTKDAKRMRMLRTRRRAEGWVGLTLWLPPDQAAAVTAVKRKNESYAELLTRLVREQGSS
ncbi:hypothetical protein F3I62_03545 [Pseudomonas sp. R-28-1W-6]|uniref:hypothetical protein n=1 Tax=Pseudomonas sp. R-28-1W-6 TaxID=2650101 RepID=UPI0013659A83|nr:hypothetical protein [Pseudomonas sp. R-28-1W-6]MWV11162.1 hypothetical protein [Pseudomonas sp. R-28-1W-6]